MAIYGKATGIKTSISGTGNSETRENEITPDGLASVRNFECGYTDYQNTGGVIKDEGHDFNCEIISNDTVHITDGIAFAYGYFGGSEAVDFTILPAAVEQYYVIYLEMNKSVIPNTCKVKIKNNYASPNIGVNVFRQDELSTVKTGVYQMPLWLLRITNKGIQETKNLRKLRSYIEHVLYSDNATNVMNNGTIGNNVTCPTQPDGDISGKIVNTAFADRAIQAEINR